MAKDAGKQTNPHLTKLSARIKRLRIEKGYSNYEVFAFKIGIARAQYGRYENGTDLKYTTLMKIIEALGMTPKEFFSEGFD